MPYAILRTTKLTSFGNIGSSAKHNFRERETPNADVGRTGLNWTRGAQSSKEVISSVKERLETQRKVRKNAVLAVEYFVGASPEWFEKASEDQREGYFDRAERWLKERHGYENVVAVTRQYDETSPHVCAYVVPIDPKGKLNCSHFLGGRQKLSWMQTDFAEKVGKPFGLERGIEGSKAEHKTIKQYYAEIQAPVRKVVISEEALKPRRYEPDGLAERLGLFRREESSSAIADRLTEAVQEAYRPAVAAAKQYQAGKEASKARERRLTELRSTAIVARDMPLESVLERLECIRDYKDKKNWRTPVGRVSVEGAKFYAHDIGKGGGGAIDLTMLIERTDYKGAVNWLAREFGTGAVLEQTVATAKREVEAAVNEPKRPYKLPDPSPDHWPRVKRYLTEFRHLSSTFVDRLHEFGKVYADCYANVVFVLGEREGVELRGTGEKPFHGVRGKKVPLILRNGGKDEKVAFVESAIDAMSLLELGFKGDVVSMAGSSTAQVREWAQWYRGRGLTIVAAFDNDRAGEQMTAQLGHPRERIYPEYGKDWNDDLRVKRARPRKGQVLERGKRKARQGHSRSSMGL